MFFLKNKKITLYFKNYFLNNYFKWLNRNLIWQFFFLGFFFDEIFSFFLKKINKIYFSLPGLYFFDKLFSFWFSYNFFKKKFNFLSSFIFFEKVNYNLFLNFLLLFFFYILILYIFFIFIF